MVFRALLLCGVFGAAFPTASAGAETPTNKCEPLRPLVGSASQYKDRGNRCEGLYETDYSGGSLVLLSLTTGSISYPLQPGVKLQVSAPSQNGEVHVRAVAKAPNTHYQMDAVLGPNAMLLWPVDDVLLPEGLASSEVGVFAWKGSDKDPVIVPVRISAAGTRPSIHGSIILTVRPSFDAQAVKWRWAVLSNGVCGRPGRWQDVVGGSMDAGSPIDVPLQQLTGPNCVDIAAQNGNDWPNISLRVELP
jgi:hypothetical protein